jgi:glycosyltransferase involved in cell wall biosynthesis
MRNVLMISPHFPPDSTAATHRVRLLAPHLARYGWQPTVLTVDPRDYEGRPDPDLAASVPSDLRVVRTRAWSASASRMAGIGDLGLRAFHGLWRGASDLLARESFDAVFITIYPAYPALLGPLLKKRFTFAFVLDYQDPWVGEWGRSVGPRDGGRPDFKSRLSRLVAARLEPHALEAADGVTAVSSATFEQALERTPAARPRARAELPIGWDRADLEHAGRVSATFPDDGLIHLSYVGTLLPAGFETLRAVLAAVAALRATNSAAARLRLHFFGTSNQRTSDAPLRVLPVAAEYGLLDVVSEHAPRLDYFEALRVLCDSTAVLLMGSRERHYTPSKVFPALMARRPVFAVMHAASNASDLLRQVGRAPTVRLVSYGDDGNGPNVDAIARELSALIDRPCYDRGAMAEAEAVLEPLSACSLAGRLANVLDRCLP